MALIASRLLKSERLQSLVGFVERVLDLTTLSQPTMLYQQIKTVFCWLLTVPAIAGVVTRADRQIEDDVFFLEREGTETPVQCLSYILSDPHMPIRCTRCGYGVASLPLPSLSFAFRWGFGYLGAFAWSDHKGRHGKRHA